MPLPSNVLKYLLDSVLVVEIFSMQYNAFLEDSMDTYEYFSRYKHPELSYADTQHALNALIGAMNERVDQHIKESNEDRARVEAVPMV